MKNLLTASLLAITALGNHPAYSANSAAPDSQQLRLQTQCGNLDNCFDNVASLLQWINEIRNPASAPLLIEAGPGEFFDFRCEGAHNITLRGAGRDKTILSYRSNYRGAALSAANCRDMNIQDLTINGNASIGIWWVDGGPATFHNIRVHNASQNSFDYCLGNNQPVIRWFDTSFETALASAMYAGCAQHWFFSSEMEQVVRGNLNPRAPSQTIRIESFGGLGDVRLYGSSIRTTVAAGVSSGRVVSVYNYGTFHSHGGEIVTNASLADADVDVVAVYSADAQKTHIVETSFGLQAGGNGTATRITGFERDPLSGNYGLPTAAQVTAPFQWGADTKPPAIQSLNGYDSFIETDCDSAGNCDGNGNLTHMMIYNQAACGATDPWFNATINRCRTPVSP